MSSIFGFMGPQTPGNRCNGQQLNKSSYPWDHSAPLKQKPSWMGLRPKASLLQKTDLVLSISHCSWILVYMTFLYMLKDFALRRSKYL